MTASIRGTAVERFLADRLDSTGSKELSLLDIGCGWGLLSFALAQHFARVVAVDTSLDRLRMTVDGSVDRGIENLFALNGDAHRLPFPDSSFGAFIANGVLEWTGVNSDNRDPAALQKSFLVELRRALRPGGLAYIACENRIAVQHLLRDPHTAQLFVTALPRGVARWWSKRMYQKEYQAYIYSPTQLKDLLEEAGFTSIEIYCPFPGYHYPLIYLPLRDRARALRVLDEVELDKLQTDLEELPYRVNAQNLVDKLRRRVQTGCLSVTSRDLVAVSRAG